MVWRLDKKRAGSGALGDLGAHVIDLARWLVGEPRRVSAMAKTFVKERPLPDGSGTSPITVDDAFVSLLEFQNGAIGTIEASRFATGHKNRQIIEVNGSKGSLLFNLERMNELEVFWKDDAPRETQGFHDVMVSEAYHPFWQHWWPHGHFLGWEHTFIHEISELLDAIVNDKPLEPYGATFDDGYKNAVICDAILQSAEDGRHVDIRY
jgi:predicted dehydrogenase